MRIGKMISEVLQTSLKKPVTTMYPAEKLELPERFRGKLKFYPEKCIGCKLCMRDCPTAAIVINNVSPAVQPPAAPLPSQNGSGADALVPPPAPPVKKQFEAVIDNSKCIYCALCVDVCPKKALEATKDVELAQFDIKELKVTFRAEPPTGPEKTA